MDAVIIPLVLLFFFGVPIALLVWGRHNNLKKWGQLARALGMSHPPLRFFSVGVPVLTGQRKGVPITVGRYAESSGSGDNQSTTHYTYAEAVIDPPLALGLGLRPMGGASRFLGSLFGGNGLETGQPEFDRQFRVQGTETEAIQLLLSKPYLSEALLTARTQPFPPHVQDASVRCVAQGKHSDPTAISRALDDAAELALRFRAARTEVGDTPIERRVNDTIRAAASALGFQIVSDGRGMVGRHRDMYVEVLMTIDGGRRQTDISVRYDRALGVGLELRAQGSLAFLDKLTGGQDIEVGDEDFDRRFVVRGEPEAAVRALLNLELRSQLLDLQKRVSVLIVRDDRLTAVVHFPILDVEVLARGVDAVASAGAALARVSPQELGPFRGA